MLAYNRVSLDNRDVLAEAESALAKAVISSAEYERIREAYPVKLYAPNIFIRLGLFLLTVLAVACGLGLFFLVAGEHGFGGGMIFWGVVSYGVLELFIHLRGMYGAGVDDALLWMAGGLIFGGINLLADNISPVVESGLVLVLAGWGVLRYADRLMGLVAYGALLSVIYHVVVRMGGFGGFGSAILPFVIMGVSGGAYFGFTSLVKAEALRHYRSCLSLLRAGALVSLYAAGNYYVVRSVHASMGGGSAGGGTVDGGAAVALGWLWWGFTVVVPVGYVVAGVRRRDAILVWTGMGLVAFAIWTVRFYYHFLPLEIAMICGGFVLIFGAYGFIRYLRVPRDGVTSAASDEPHLLEGLGVEGLVVAESFRGVGGGGALERGGTLAGGVEVVAGRAGGIELKPVLDIAQISNVLS